MTLVAGPSCTIDVSASELRLGLLYLFAVGLAFAFGRQYESVVVDGNGWWFTVSTVAGLAIGLYGVLSLYRSRPGTAS